MNIATCIFNLTTFPVGISFSLTILFFHYSAHFFFMSRIMKKKYRQGKGNPNWKGGQIKDTSSYVHSRAPDHPFASKNGFYVLRSHLVAEKILNRYLTPNEQVHHINEIRDDDRPKNLYLFANKSDHIGYHRLKSKPILISNLFTQ